VEIRHEENILFIQLNKPEKANSFGEDEARQFDEALSKYSDCRAILCSNTGRWFCAGGDLKYYARTMDNPQLGLSKNHYICQVLDRLCQHPAFTVAAVDGDCFGGGMELLSAFDYVMATPHCYFGLWQRRMGLSFGWGGGRRLQNRVGQQRLRNQALLAQSFSAQHALRQGWVDELLPSELLLEKAEQRILSQEKYSALALEKIKLRDQLSEEEIFVSLWGSPDHLKALSHFK
jgi:2-(1,2-epoxy-1,2-dihydrophenyl)acetyl-CoA isomerase